MFKNDIFKGLFLFNTIIEMNFVSKKYVEKLYEMLVLFNASFHISASEAGFNREYQHFILHSFEYFSFIELYHLLEKVKTG